MLSAIKLDGEGERRAIEIENVVAGRVLSPKTCPFELPAAQFSPHTSFDFGFVATQSASMRCLDRRSVEARSSDPHPARFARRPPPFRGRWTELASRVRPTRHHRVPFTALTA